MAKKRKRTTSAPKASHKAPLYRALRKVPLEIRLLEILRPKSSRSIVNCRLITVSLDDAPEYTALSYVWGPPSRTRNIRVNGRLMPVTTNLNSALRQFRACLFNRHVSGSQLRRLPPRFWIDAVCINQKDVEERNHQVQCMPTVYQRASSVLVWLSPRNGELSYGMAAIGLTGRELSSSDDKTNLKWMYDYPQLWDHDCSNGVENEAWNAIDQLLRLNYWKRVWTLQERVLAKRLWYMVGSSIVDEQYFEEVEALLTNIVSGIVPKPWFYSDITWGILSTEMYFPLVRRMFFNGVVASAGEKSDALQSFFVTIRYRATDPRDKIYAVLGLYGHLMDDDSLLPNYRLSVETLYCNFGRAYIRSTGNHELLCFSGSGHDIPRNYDLPSWIPDWDGVSKSTGFLLAPYQFHADGDLRTLVKSRSYVSDRDELHLYGSVCDTVFEMEPMMLFPSDDFDQFCSTYCFSHGHRYKTGIPLIQALLRTLKLDPNAKRESFNHEVDLEKSLREVMTFIRVPFRAMTQEGKELALTGFLNDFLACSSDRGQNRYTKLRSLRNIMEKFEEGTMYIPILAEITLALSSLRLFHTATGFLGLAPEKSLPGDLVCAIRKCSFPILLRKEQSHYVHVGPCFVLGLMNGEVDELIESGTSFIQEFVVF